MSKNRKAYHFPGETFFDDEAGLWGFTCAPRKTVLDSEYYTRAIAGGSTIWHENKPPVGTTFTDLGGDLFHSFYFPNTELLPDDEVPEERSLTHLMLKWFRQEQIYQGFQDTLYEDSLAASMAAGTAWQYLVNDTTIAKILALQEELNRLKEQMRANGDDPDDGDEDGAGDKDGGQTRRELQKVRDKVGKTKEKMQEGTAQYALQQKMAEAARQGGEKGEQTRDLMNGLQWGEEPGDVHAEDIKPILEFMNRNSQWIRALVKVIGRARKVALKAAHAKAQTNHPLATGGYTQALEHLAPEELGRLGSDDEALQAMTVLQLHDRGLFGWKQKAQFLEEGYFTLAADVSGSMGYEEFMVATGVALGLARAAHDQSRKYSLHKFDTRITASVKSTQGWKKHLDWTASNSGGGTNFDPPLNQMADEIEEALAKASGPHKGMDGVIISDGYATLSDRTKKRWQALKKQGVRLLYVAVGDGDGELNKLADRTLELYKMDLEHGEKVAEAVGQWLAD